jgi:NADH:ubiquinone oxidoreductase subunit H
MAFNWKPRPRRLFRDSTALEDHARMPLEYGFNFWVTLILIVVVMGAIQGTCAYLILAERKISAWAQDRIGPNRVGPFGLLQPIADGAKFLLKEEVIPSHVDKVFYLIAPAVAVGTALLAFAVVPFGPTTTPPVLVNRLPELTDEQRSRAVKQVESSLDDLSPESDNLADVAKSGLNVPPWQLTVGGQKLLLAADAIYAEANHTPPFQERLDKYNASTQFVIAPHVDIGIVFVFAVGSLAVYAIVLGGWSSNSKYSFLGSLRSSAQFISYEIPLGMSVLGVMLLAGSLNLETIIGDQCRHGWNVLWQPLAAWLFMTSVFAECNRLPFDLPEAEQELVGGYHTEYSAMKFALFFLGEYTHMITTSFLVVIMFFGGWSLPWIATPDTSGIFDTVLKVGIIGGKMVLFIIFFMLIRWTLPRFRFDQLMGLAWKVMMPLALVSFLCVMAVKYLGWDQSWVGRAALLPPSLLLLIGAAAVAILIPRKPPLKKVYFRGHTTDAKVMADS